LPPASPRQPVCGEEQDSPIGRTRYIAISMQQFADELRGYVTGWVTTPGSTGARIGAPLDTRRVRHELVALRRPDIVDRTGLTGRYDIELRAFAPTAALMGRYPFLTGLLEPLGFSSIPRALEDQLGLRLVESEAPYDVIVIDRAERP
jgi:uncharacterized protein (TIGR03435 family)